VARDGSGQPRLGRSSVDLALAWIDAATHCIAGDDAPLRQAAGRVLAEDIHAAEPIPSRDAAALDGFAVEAQQTLGANS